MSNSHAIGKILKQHLERKKDGRQTYSLRMLARDMKISPSHLSRALRGEKMLSSAQLKKTFRLLDVDLETQSKIMEFYAAYKIGSLGRKLTPIKTRSNHLLNFKSLGKRRTSLLSKWYYIPVLEYLSISKHQDLDVISRRLGITLQMARESIDLLKELELIIPSQTKENIWIRNLDKIRLASASSKPEIRAFHAEMIHKASVSLLKTDEQSFNLRLITGVTIGVNPEKLEQAKMILNDALHRASELLHDENASEVYQLNLQIFPLTK